MLGTGEAPLATEGWDSCGERTTLEVVLAPTRSFGPEERALDRSQCTIQVLLLDFSVQLLHLSVPRDFHRVLEAQVR